MVGLRRTGSNRIRPIAHGKNRDVLLQGRAMEGCVFPLLLGVLFSLSSDAGTYGAIQWGQAHLYLNIVLYGLLFWVLFAMMFRFCFPDRIGSFSDDRAGKQKNSLIRRLYFNHIESPRGVLCDGTRILICWLPYLILLYPGSLFWDTGDQLAQYYGIAAFSQAPGVISDRHPFFDTFLYGWFSDFGRFLTGSPNFGFSLYVIIQFILFAICIAWLLAYMSTRAMGKRIIAICTAFFCLFPLVPMMAMMICKDTTHALFFLPWAILFVKLVDGRLEPLKNPRFLSAFIVLTLLSSLTKKMGLYIIVVSLLLLVLGHFRRKMKVLAACLAASIWLVVNMLIPACLFPVLHVVPGEKVAAIVMPVQVLSRTAHDHPTAIADSQKKAVDEMMPFGWEGMAAKYIPYISDPVTGYGANGPKGSLPGFARLWVNLGLHHPLSYLNGFFCLEGGWTSFVGPQSTKAQKPPYKQDPMVMHVYTWTMTNPDTYGRLQKDPHPNWRQRLADETFQTLTTIPVLNVCFYVAVWSSVVPFFILYAAWRRRGRERLMVLAMRLAPYFVSVLSLFAYPISFSVPGRMDPTRYVFHAVLTAPLALGALYSANKKMSEEGGFAADPAYKGSNQNNSGHQHKIDEHGRLVE